MKKKKEKKMMKMKVVVLRKGLLPPHPPCRARLREAIAPCPCRCRCRYQSLLESPASLGQPPPTHLPPSNMQVNLT